MNKKGFTLVELLAVIVVLGLIITITATKGFGAFSSIKRKIHEENVKAYDDVIKTLLVDVELCEDDDYIELKGYFYNTSSSTSCEELKDNIAKYSPQVKHSQLKKGGYFTDDDFEDLATATYYVTFNTSTNKGSISSKRVENTDVGVNSRFETNNGGIDNSTARTVIQFKPKTDGKLSFKYKCDSESNDKFSFLIFTGDSGITPVNKGGKYESTYEKKLYKNVKYQIEFEYKKDGSGAQGKDGVIIEDFDIPSDLEYLYKYEGVYYFE